MCTCICVLQKAEQVSCRFFHFPGGSWAPGMPQRFWAGTLLRVHSCQIFVDKFPSILHLRWNSLCGCFFFAQKSINYSHSDINAPDRRYMEGLDLRGSESFGRFRLIEGSGVWKVLAHLKISGGFLKFEVSSSGSGGF